MLQAAGHFGGRTSRPTRKGGSTAGSVGRAPTGAAAPSTDAPVKLAVFIGGYVRNFSEEIFAPVRSNVAMDYAFYDESSFLNTNHDGDMRHAPETRRMVNSVLGDQPVSEVEIGRRYGDQRNHTLRVVYNTSNIHPILPYDSRAIAHILDFFTSVFELKPTLAATNQTWLLKELCTLVALIGGLSFVVALVGLLLQWPYFRELAGAKPPALPRPAGVGRWLFWSVFVVSALFACFSFIPMARASIAFFPAANSGQPSWLFPARMNNAILLWAVFNGVVGFVLFWLSYRFHGRKHGVVPAMLGLRINARELGKTAVLAVAAFVGFYGLLFLVYGVFHTDFRFVLVAAAASFPERAFIVLLEYAPLFLIFFLSNSIRVNSAARIEGRREWANLLVLSLGTVAGLLLIGAMHYSMLAVTGNVLWTEERLFVTILYGVIPVMFMLPFFHRWFFRMTGKVYLGPMVMCPIFVMMMLTSNVCYIPL